jgi:hypothetical protein
MVYLDGYEFFKSQKKNKKYDVFKNGRFLASFGAIKNNGIPYEHYYDKIKLFSAYNHYDELRRMNYAKRHKKDLGKKESAGWFAYNYLW